jgi:hypothetical protein
MKRCLLCGKDYEDFYINCPACELGGKNGHAADSLISEQPDSVESTSVFLTIANVTAITFATISLLINNAGANRGFGGFGFTVVGGFCGMGGAFIALILLVIALARRERPALAYLTCLLAPSLNYLLFK